MARATRRGSLGSTSPGSTGIPVNVTSDSTAPVMGDWMILTMVLTGTTLTVTPPSSQWTQLVAPTLMGTRMLAVYGARRGAETGGYTFTASGNSTTQSHLIWGPGGVVQPSGWTIGTLAKRSATSTTLSITGITTSKASYAVAAFGEASAVTTNEPGGFTITGGSWSLFGSSQAAGLNSVILAEVNQTTPASTGDALLTVPNTSANAAGVVIAIPELVDVVTDLLGAITNSTGGIVQTVAKLWDGTAMKGLAKMDFVQYGKPLATLESSSPTNAYLVAHRTGSIDWAEGTAMGATQSMVRGMHALEAPVARTSDGVYFLLHDQTINRTSPSAPASWDPKDHTWAEVQAFNVTVGNAQNRGAQPYYKLTDLLATFGGKTMIFIDAKLIAQSNYPELIALLQTVPGYQQWIMGKYYCTNTVFADAFKAAGMKSWGYGYTADLDNGNLQRTAPKWDFIGIEYSADDAHWATLRSIGKPIIGHICPDTAAVKACTNRGAIGAMVSGVINVTSGL